jgi:hypothetical protein
MKGYLDLATALFALAAAVFWFQASGKLPPMGGYFGTGPPPTDPHMLAVARSVRLNSVAALLSGLSAACAFLGYWAR